MLDTSYNHFGPNSKLKRQKNKIFFLINVSKNRKNGVKKNFVIIFERFDILKTLKYIRQMRDEIKCNKAHYFF